MTLSFRIAITVKTEEKTQTEKLTTRVAEKLLKRQYTLAIPLKQDI